MSCWPVRASSSRTESWASAIKDATRLRTRWMSNQRSSGIFVGTGGMSGGDILPVLPSNLLRFRERREGIADRHLAGLVALQPHFFENLAAGDTLAARDEFEQLVALGIGPATSATATGFASLLTF